MADVTFTIAILDDGTPVLREIKKEAQSMGETVATAGKQAAAGLSAVAKEEGTLAAVTRTATKAAQDELQLLTQKIAIQQKVRDGALTVAQGTRQMAEAEIYAKTGSRELSQALAAARGEFDQHARALREMKSQADRLGQVWQRTSSLLSAAGILVGLSAVVSLIKNAVSEGLRYNSVLEQQRIGIAAIIAATNDITDAQGRTLEGAEEFHAAQQLSAGLMQQIQKDALLTTATTEQLVEAFQSALGPLSAAGLSLNQSREATLRIVQAAAALGVPMHQVAQEVRAIAEGSIDVNARLAKALGITNEQVKAAAAQGKLFEFILAKTQAFAAAGDVTARSFSGLSSSIADVASQLAGRVFATPFEGVKAGLAGVLDFLQSVNTAMVEQEEQAARTAHALQVLAEAQRNNRSATEQAWDILSNLAVTLGGAFLEGITNAWQGTVRFVAVLKNIADISIDALFGPLIAGFKAVQAGLAGGDPLRAFSEAISAMGRNIGASAQRIGSAFTEVNFTLSGTAELLARTNQFALSFVPTQQQVADATFRVRDATDLQGRALLTVNGGLQQYTTSASGAAEAAQKLAEAQEKFRAGLAEDNAALQLKVQVLEQATLRNASLADALAEVTKAEQVRKAGSTAEAEQNAALQSTYDALVQGMRQTEDRTKALAREKEQLAKATEREAAQTAKAASEARAQIAIYEQVAAGLLTSAAAQRQLEAAQLATRVGSAALARQLLDTKQAAEDKAKTDELIVRLSAEHAKALLDEARALDALVTQTTRTAEQNRDLAATIEDGIKAGRTYDSILRDVAIRQKEMELTGKVAADQVHKLAVASVDAAAELDKQEAALQKLNGAPIDFGDRIIDNFSQVLVGIRQNTREIGGLLDGLQDTFVTTFIEMFAKTLKEKVNWEIALSDNLLNDLPALFTQSGAQSGQGFLSSLFSWLGNTGGQTQGLGAGFGVIFGSESIDAAGVEWTSGWPDIFDGLGGTAQTGGKSFGSAFGIAAIASIAATVGQDFSRGQYGAGAGGIVGGAIGAFFGPAGAALGGQIGRLLGGLLDPLFAPGRIQKEKQRLEDYFDEVFGGGFDIVKEKQAALGLATFEASRAAALALGATDARRTTGSNAGTVVRFGGQLEGNFEEQGKSAEEAKKAVLRLAQAMGVDLATSIDDINELVKTNVFSLSEFAEEVEESRKNLKKYGDTSGLTVKQLNELALANGNTGSFVVTLNELYAGAIDLATGFSKSIDGLAIANKLLSQTFLEAAGGADALNGNVGVLAGQIKDGTLSIEEAVTQLNAMRAAAGQTQLSLDQITLHPEEIAKEVAIIQTALEEGAQAAQGFGSLLGNAIMNGLAPLGEDVKNFFRALFGNQILGGIIQTAITTLNIQGILAPIFEEIIRAQEALASKTITEEEYKARLKGILADAGPEIEKIKAGLLAAGEAGRALLDELGLLPDTLDDATDSADALVARIRDLQAEIRELANERIEIHLQVLDDLASIGFLPALDAIDARIASIQDRIAGFGIGPIATSPFGHLSDADLKTLIDLQDQLRQATLARYQEEARLIQERAQAAISQIQEEYAARRQAIQETINGLQAQRSATQKLYQEQLQKLQEQLAVAQEFGRVADSLTQIIRNATQSAESPLDRNQQFTLLQREADVIRRSLLSATGRERAEQIGDLAQILQSQLSFVDRNSAGGQQLFNRLLTELASLRGDAQKEGDNAAKIQEEIKNTTARMDAALASIDKRIAAQQALLASLSAQEQAEIRKVQETAQAELRALQERTAREIQEQAERRDLALQEQIRRLEAQEKTAREQLEKLVGAEAAQKLLAAGDEAHTLQLAQANLTLFAIDARIKELVDKIQPAATGYHNTGSGNHLFLTHPNERIDITPAGQRAPVSSGGGASVAISFAPVVHVTVAPGEEGRVKQDVNEVLRMAEVRVKRLIQTDWVPEIRRAAEGRL